MAPRKSLFVLESLPELIPPIFDQAQHSMANHRKNCVALHKLQVQAAAVMEPIKQRAAVNLTGEKKFGDVFIDMVSRVLVVKKGPAPAERVFRFISSYIKFLIEKCSQPKEGRRVGSSSNSDDDDTLAVRFVSRLLRWLLQGFVAKDKTVRLRSVSLVAELVVHLGELDEDMYASLRENLIERVRDRESSIRALAIVGLSKLLGGEDPNDLPEDEPSILDVLLDSLCYDTVPEVRRAALLHIPLMPQTLPTLLSRTRDTDPGLRKLLYSTVLFPTDPRTSKGKSTHEDELKLTHPRQLTLAQREQAVRDGLCDREDAVRLVAGRMVGSWFDIMRDGVEGASVFEGLIQFIKLFDVAGPEGADVAVDALKSLCVTRVDILDGVEFSDEFWKNLAPESALVARVFITYCLDHDAEKYLENTGLPVVTALAFYLQEACNELLDAIEELTEARMAAESEGADGTEDEDEDLDRKEDAVLECGFVVGEMLRLAARSDFTDEIGRRKVFAVVREMLTHELLPENLMEPCLDVLKETTAGERELIRIVVEMVHELRDGIGGEDNVLDQISRSNSNASFDTTQSSIRSRSKKRSKEAQEMTSEERAKADAMDMRCLALCIAMLSRVNGSFDENSTLEGVLADLIIPAVRRKELALRERGLVSLGLCCLIAKNMAMSSFQLFLNQVQSAPEELKVKVLQVIFDVLMVYEEEFLRRSGDVAEKIVTFLLQTLEVEESETVQAILCIGISKLVLCGLVIDERVLASLVLAYVSPVTAQNQQLRQCLAYCLPAYCYSSATNQSRMQSVAMVAYDLVVRVHQELGEDEEMITPYQFGLLLIDWTNPQKSVNVEAASTGVTDVHVDLAIDIVKALHDEKRLTEDKKVLCQLLGKLYFPDNPNPLSLLILNTLVANLEEQNLLEDPALEKMIDRFRSRFTKLFSKQLEKLDERLYFKEPRFREMCKDVGIDIEADSASEDEGRDVQEDLVANGPSSPERTAEDAKDSLSYVTVNREASSSPASTAPTRKGKEKAGSVRTARDQNRAVIQPSSEDEEEQKENTAIPEPAFATPKKPRATKRTRSPGQPAFASPVHKRISHRQTPKKLAVDVGDPFDDATNSRKNASGNKKDIKARGKVRPHSPPGDSSEDDGNEIDDAEGSTFNSRCS
ncbi:hypothetical protein SCP_1402980 [Sparassis crispa]|uniref:Nuclear condensin complex subunit 3 C-terminal domain-containing protein n=1 Tax=Sparassis crispa TaxID=139825 RepID=A0A401H3G1_9APHY|nr:hypothetical protein SCP_1402980 [Sparassis crispa]GBE88890.1 hypothetical protein SCP_1402980 [Sparassis crispa]